MVDFYRGFALESIPSPGTGQCWRLYALSREAMDAAEGFFWVRRETGYWIGVEGDRFAIRRMLDGVLEHGRRYLGRGYDPNGAWRLLF